jgi:hypothetical protein
VLILGVLIIVMTAGMTVMDSALTTSNATLSDVQDA